MNQLCVTAGSMPTKAIVTGYPRKTVSMGPGLPIEVLLSPQPRDPSPYRVKAGGSASVAEAEGRLGIRSMHRRTAATAAALSGCDMKGCNHRVMIQAAKFRAVDLEVSGDERLEPVLVHVARNHVNLQAVRRDGEGMGDIDRLEQELDDLAHLHREGPGLRTAVRAVRICHVETPRPLLRCYDHGHIRILRNRVGDHEGLEGR